MTTAPKRNEKLAIESLGFGILSLIVGPLAGIPAVIYGHMAKARIKKNPDTLKGKGLALSGLIMGYIGIFIIGLLITMMLLAFVRIAKSTACISNLHQMQVGLEKYADAHSGIYPPDIMTLKKFLAGSADVTNMNCLFSCPGSGKKDGNDYVMAPDLKADDLSWKDAIWDASLHNHGRKGRNFVTLGGSIGFRKWQSTDAQQPDKSTEPNSR
jgi:hypothetical protein